MQQLSNFAAGADCTDKRAGKAAAAAVGKEWVLAVFMVAAGTHTAKVDVITLYAAKHQQFAIGGGEIQMPFPAERTGGEYRKQAVNVKVIAL